MAKKKAESKSMPATAESGTKHARIELTEENYRRLKAASDRYQISVAAYIRMAVMERIERDETTKR